MENLLSLVALVTGIGAGSLFLVAARQQPDKAQQMRGLSALFFGVAALMAVLLVL